MAKRIKILFTIPNFDTAGSGRVVYDLVKGLDKTRFAPEICCFHDGGTYFETIKTLEVPIHVFQFTTPYRPRLSFPFRVLKIYRFFKKHRFDIIHSWHWSSDISEPLAAKWAGIPFVYTKKAMGWGSKFWMWRSKLSTRIVTINEDMVNEYFSGMLHKIVRISLGVDTQRFHPSLGFNLNRKELHLKQDDFVVITVANLVAVKGIEGLIQAIQMLGQDEVKLLIVGDYHNAYGEWLKDTYESNGIQFVGKQMDVRPYLALSDVFVIPTKNEGRREGLPIALLEAMACERIVLGSNISGIKDILKGHQELLFHPNDIGDLMRKINAVRGLDANESEKLKKAMRQTVLQQFSMDRFIVSHETLYQNLIR